MYVGEWIIEMQDKIMAKDAEIAELKNEIAILRQFGNKDCTAMADEALKKEG